jgi:ABC-type phosphate transport system substrate-binding protein
MRRLSFAAACLCGVAGLWLAPGPSAGSAQRVAPTIAVIVHPGARVQRLDRHTLAAIFTLSMRHWDSGGAIVALNYPPHHELRVAYDRAVLAMSPDEVALFWIGQRVRGKGSAPRAATSPQLMLKVVENLRGAIGYVPIELRSTRVTTVATIAPSGRVTPGAGP